MEYYTIQDIAVIDAHRFKLPGTCADSIYLVQFWSNDLESPSSEPIGVYYRAGIRRFYWGKRFWIETEVNYRDISNKVTLMLSKQIDKVELGGLNKILDLLHIYHSGPPPSFIADGAVTHCRAMKLTNDVYIATS